MQDLIDETKNWLIGKTQLAHRLAAGECGGSYGDAVLVLSAIVSCIAAQLWPGDRIDRKRFMEVWWRYSAPELHPNHVSLPFLVETLRNQGAADDAENVRCLRENCISEIPSLDSLVVTGERVDVT